MAVGSIAELDLGAGETISLDTAYEMMSDPDRVDSLAEIVSLLSDEDRAVALSGVDADKLQYDWNFWGRPKQQVPDEPYSNVHLILAGRGFGKSRLASEWIRKKAMEKPETRLLVLGRTMGDVRDTMVSGESGVLGIPQPEEERPHYFVNETKVVWPNKSVMLLKSAEKPDGVRGAQAHYAVADEMAAYTPYVGVDGLTAFENLRIATRLGDKPQLLVTTTPKRVQSLKDLLAEAEEKGPANVRVVRGTTLENAGNLASVYLDVLMGNTEGTVLFKQEILGEMLDEDMEGVLWAPDDIRVFPMEEEAKRRFSVRIIGVDPSVSAEPKDECGIIVAGCMTGTEMHRRKAYVLEDASVHGGPEVWAQKVVETARKWNVHGVVVEKNQGGELASIVLRNIDPTLRIFPVWAGVSKKERAEPVAFKYQQKKVLHTEEFVELRDQMTSWQPGVTKKSPDRIDALVHAITALLLAPPKGLLRSPVSFVPPRGGLPIGGLGTGAARSWGGSR